jgi:hypothetical protein
MIAKDILANDVLPGSVIKVDAEGGRLTLEDIGPGGDRLLGRAAG